MYLFIKNPVVCVKTKSDNFLLEVYIFKEKLYIHAYFNTETFSVLIWEFMYIKLFVCKIVVNLKA